MIFQIFVLITAVIVIGGLFFAGHLFSAAADQFDKAGDILQGKDDK